MAIALRRAHLSSFLISVRLLVTFVTLSGAQCDSSTPSHFFILRCSLISSPLFTLSTSKIQHLNKYRLKDWWCASLCWASDRGQTIEFFRHNMTEDLRRKGRMRYRPFLLPKGNEKTMIDYYFSLFLAQNKTCLESVTKLGAIRVYF